MEYVALGDGVKEALFRRAGLSFIAPELTGSSIRALEDNQGAIAPAENHLSSARSKHIDVRLHYYRELLRPRRIAVPYMPALEQHADLLMKALEAV